ncbi:MAG TPA: hypothetical protein VJT13_17495 [Xanthobacteraceae bacterium]|nr:hypothetical protein [Xanthobacteraceae bacterium]
MSAAIILASAAITIAVYFVVATRNLEWDARLIAMATISISAGTFAITSISAASAILLGWRSDRRAAGEAELKMKQMELQIAELQRKLGETPPHSN